MKSHLFRLAIPSDTSKLYDADGELSKRLRSFLESIASGERGVLVVIGGYGMGKTHVLRHLKHLAENKGFIGIYVESPGRNFLDLYSRIVEELFDIVVSSPDEVRNSALKHALKLYQQLGNGLSVYVKSWILGHSIPPTIKYKLGLIGKVNESSAVRYLSDILATTARRVKGVLILIDEVEALLNLPKFQRAVYVELLRETIDALPESVGLALSMTPACWESLSSLNPALTRRLSGGLLYLKPLKREHLKGFLELYFAEEFSEDLLDLLYELSNGIHGEVLKYASILLEESRYRGLRNFDGSNAKALLADYV